MVGCGDLYGARKIENNLVNVNISFAPCSHHGVANLNREFGFCLRECFRTVFIPEVRSVLRAVFVCQLSNQLGMCNRKVQGLFLGITEYDIAEAWGGGVVHVYNDMLGTRYRLICPLDQVCPRGGEDLQGVFRSGK